MAFALSLRLSPTPYCSVGAALLVVGEQVHDSCIAPKHFQCMHDVAWCLRTDLRHFIFGGKGQSCTVIPRPPLIELASLCCVSGGILHRACYAAGIPHRSLAP